MLKAGFFFIWMIATCTALGFALQPKALPLTMDGADKILHLAVFLTLTLIPAITFDKISSVILGLLFVAAIGIGIECIQHFMPTRKAEVMDVVYDMIGIAIGACIGLSLRRTYQELLPRAYVEAYIRPKS